MLSRPGARTDMGQSIHIERTGTINVYFRSAWRFLERFSPKSTRRRTTSHHPVVNERPCFIIPTYYQQANGTQRANERASPPILRPSVTSAAQRKRHHPSTPFNPVLRTHRVHLLLGTVAPRIAMSHTLGMKHPPRGDGAGKRPSAGAWRRCTSPRQPKTRVHGHHTTPQNEALSWVRTLSMVSSIASFHSRLSVSSFAPRCVTCTNMNAGGRGGRRATAARRRERGCTAKHPTRKLSSVIHVPSVLEHTRIPSTVPLLSRSNQRRMSSRRKKNNHGDLPCVCNALSGARGVSSVRPIRTNTPQTQTYTDTHTHTCPHTSRHMVPRPIA